MTFEYNDAVGINNKHVRNTTHTEVLTCSTSCMFRVVVLYCGPAFSLNVFLTDFGATIDRATDNTYFAFPLFTVLLEHLLIVSHRSLARRAPCGPEINEKNLAFLVRDSGLAFGHYVVSVLNRRERCANIKANLDINFVLNT